MNDARSGPLSAHAQAGSLILMPNTLDLAMPDTTVALHEVLPQSVLETAAQLHHWVCENAKTTRAFLKRIDAIVPLARPLQELDIRELPRATKGRTPAPPPNNLAALLEPAREGRDIGLVSDAGMPAIADPGALLVAAAHATGIAVRALVGPNSLMLALAASGLNGQSFAFVGYVPQDAQAQAQRLKELEAVSARSGQTQLMIETPYRNASLLRALLTQLSPSTRLSVSCGLTLPGAWTATRTVAQWREHTIEMPSDIPAVFALLA